MSDQERDAFFNQAGMDYYSSNLERILELCLFILLSVLIFKIYKASKDSSYFSLAASVVATITIIVKEAIAFSYVYLGASETLLNKIYWMPHIGYGFACLACFTLLLNKKSYG